MLTLRSSVRRRAILVGSCLGFASAAYAQAPAPAFVVLGVPSSARTAALGNAFVAGRDNDVIFYNPAQLIAARGSEFAFGFTRHSDSSHHVTLGSSYAAGKWSLTLGWGVQFLDFHAGSEVTPPYMQDALLAHGPANGSSMLVAVGGAFVYKTFRIGAAGKFVADQVDPPGNGGAGSHVRAILADLGAARNLFGGTFAASVQNLGRGATTDGSSVATPKQVLFGYSTTRSVGPLDLGIYSQGLVRSKWFSPAGGLELGYSWIEGYAVTVRAGARRPETPSEIPLTLGAAITADRLTVEYGVQFFHGGRAVNGVTVRWR